MWSFVDNKERQRWLWYAWEPRLKQIIAHAFGSRSKKTLHNLLKLLLRFSVAFWCTQSEVSQQMQRLEQLVGKELFARQGRNKLLTEHGVQFLGYARKILQFNDEACTSLMYSDMLGTLAIGACEDTADNILPTLLHRVTTMFPKLTIDVSVKTSPELHSMLEKKAIDLAITTMSSDSAEQILLRTSPTMWYCAADYRFRQDEPVSLVLLDEPSNFRALAITLLNEAGIPWRIAYVESTLPAVRAAVKAGLGVTVRTVEMMNPELRVLGTADGLLVLPDTQYFLCKRGFVE